MAAAALRGRRGWVQIADVKTITKRVLNLAIAVALAALPPAFGQERPRSAEAERLANELAGGQGVGGEFALRDARGKQRRLAEFRGKLVLLYFGFTTCPDICPTDLLAIGTAVKRLGPRASEVQPVFVTLDPARDTPVILREYVRNFHPRFVALTGTESEIRDVARAYKVFFERVAMPGALGYTIDHAANVYLLDRQGKFVTAIPPGLPADRIARIVQGEMQ